MQYNDIEDCWREIRATRHEPVGWATISQRKHLYTSALEQSEQFFRMADRAGYETSPVMLFYGLSQAGRALSAVYSGPDQRWELFGHGISCKENLNHVKVLGDLKIRSDAVNPEKPASFTCVAERLGSEHLPRSVEMRELWKSLPEGFGSELAGSGEIYSAGHLRLVEVVGDLRPEVRRATLYGTLAMAYREQDATLHQALVRRFPGLEVFMPKGPNGEPGVSKLGTITNNAMLTLRPFGTVTSYEALLAGFYLYQDDDERETHLIPTLGGNDRPLQPLVTWWAILFGLSMLARYRPSAWSKMLDIDKSPDAAQIEFMLRRAHQVCANLIAFHLRRAPAVDLEADPYPTAG